MEKRINYAEAAKMEFLRVSANWIECQVKWKNLHAKKELNLELKEKKIDMHDHLWGTNMKVLMDYLIEESGEEYKFGHLTEMCCNSPCKLGTLTSESFSERMKSVHNLLVNTHRIHLDDEMTDKIIVLRMSKRFMERVRTKKAF